MRCSVFCLLCCRPKRVGTFPVRVVESNYELIRPHRITCGPDVQLQLVVNCNVSRFPWQFPRIIDDEQIEIHRRRKRKWRGRGRETRSAVLHRKSNIIGRTDSRAAAGGRMFFLRMQHVLAAIWNNCMH